MMLGISQDVVGTATLDDDGIRACHNGYPVTQGDIASVGIAACHGATAAAEES